MQPYYDLPDAAICTVNYRSGKSRSFKGFFNCNSDPQLYENDKVRDDVIATLHCSAEDSKHIKKNTEIDISVPMFGLKGTGKVVKKNPPQNGEVVLELYWVEG